VHIATWQRGGGVAAGGARAATPASAAHWHSDGRRGRCGDQRLVGDVESAARLEQLGWQAGRNLQIDERWTGGDPARTRRFAGGLLASPAEGVSAFSQLVAAPWQRESRTAPMVFTAISDPVGSGFVQSLARPGGNATGFTNFVPTMAAK